MAKNYTVSSEPKKSSSTLYAAMIIVGFVLGGLVGYLYGVGSSSTIRCDQFHEPAFQGTCYSNLAVDTLDASTCAKVAGLGSVNGCYKDVAIAANDASICASIDDNLMKDSCYNRVAVNMKDKATCDMIKDANLRSGCYAEIGIPVQNNSGSQIPPKNTSTTTPPTDQETAPFNPALYNQKLSIASAYLCGSDVCFQIKAESTNKIAIDLKYLEYNVLNQEREAEWWDGGWQNAACTTKASLGPGQNCFAKITNITCKMNDKINVSIKGISMATRTISGCKA